MYDSAGVQQWVATFNGAANSNDYARALALDPSGNVNVVGRTGVGVGGDYFTVKYNSDGAQQWLATYSSTPGAYSDAHASAIAVDAASLDHDAAIKTRSPDRAGRHPGHDLSRDTFKTVAAQGL